MVKYLTGHSMELHDKVEQSAHSPEERKRKRQAQTFALKSLKVKLFLSSSLFFNCLQLLLRNTQANGRRCGNHVTT